MSEPKRLQPRAPTFILVIFGLLLAAIVVAGYIVIRGQQADIVAEHEKVLISVRDLKILQINEWWAERMGDAAVISGDPFLASAVETWLRDPGRTDLQDQLLRRMSVYRNVYDYASVRLLDAKGEPRLSLEPLLDNMSEKALREISDAVRTGELVVSDFELERETNTIHLHLIVPMRNRTDEVVGFVFFGIDPRRFLFPLLRQWPASTESAETLLVRREGDRMVCMNDVRFRENAAMNLGVSMDDLRFPGPMAAQGFNGVTKAIDYRGAPVLTAVSPIPDHPWFLITKMDVGEIRRPMERRALVTAFAVAILIALSGVSVLAWWRGRWAGHYRDLLEAEREREAMRQHYAYLSKYANDIVLVFDDHFRVIEANERAETAYGRAREELIGMDARELRSDEERPRFDRQIDAVKEKGSGIYETVQRRKDGTTFPVEISTRVIPVDDGLYYQSIIRDITERQQAEQRIQEQLEELQRWYGVMLDREDRVLELKCEVNELCDRLGEEIRYGSGGEEPGVPRKGEDQA